VEAEVGIEPA